jgi:hypothetical protein
LEKIMFYTYIGLAVALIVIGSVFTVYRNRNHKGVDLPTLRNNFGSRRELNEQFVAWVGRMDDMQGSGAWLKALEPKERVMLIREVEAFCKDVGFRLPWLISEQIEDTQLREHLETAVLRYLQSHQAGMVAQEELRVYVALVDLLNNAERRSYRPKTQAVYLQLANSQVIPNVETNLLFKKDRRRWEYAAEAIAAVSRTDREAVNQAIRQHVLGETPVIPPVSTPAPVVAATMISTPPATPLTTQ